MPTNAAKRIVGGRAPQLNFPVTAEHIAAAIPEDSSHCMIADGLKAAMPHAKQVTVDLATIRFTDERNGRRYVYLTPAPAQVALLMFDHADPRLVPFTVKAMAAQIVEPREERPRPALPEAPESLPAADVKVLPETTVWDPDREMKVLPETSSVMPEEEMKVLPETTALMVVPERSSEVFLSATEDSQIKSLAESAEPKMQRRRAELIKNPAGGGTAPIKVNGSPPPFGPLAWGAGTGNLPNGYRTGRKRGYGLRIMGR